MKKRVFCNDSSYIRKKKPVGALNRLLEQIINNLIDQGCTTFLSGMAEGFDMLAAEAGLRIRMKRPEIKLIAVVPFQGQELGYTPLDKERYKIICELANKIVFTSQSYHDKVYFIRNDYLLENSSLLVCYYDGQRGGTMYTYNRAVSKKMKIINLCCGARTVSLLPFLFVFLQNETDIS